MSLDREDPPATSQADAVFSTSRSDIGRRAPALILAIASVLPAVAAAAWVAVALPLLVLHVYLPVPATVLGLAFAVVLGRPAVRMARAAAATFGEVPWWVLIGVLVIVAVFGVLAFVHSAEDVLVRRDPGSYAMSATWLSSHGTIQMPTHAQLFGAPNSNLILASQGFYRQGVHVIPQFMNGVPALLAIGGWMTGLTGVLHGNAVIGMLALLAFAGLAVRLVGARWAPLAVLALALLQPELNAMRATYSEPAAQLILLGGLAIVVDALAAGRLMPHRPGSVGIVTTPPALAAEVAARGLFVGGLVLGLVSVVRIDAIADLFPLVPLLGWLAFRRVRGWRRLALGMLTGLAFGAFDCLVLTLPYAKHLGSDLRLVGAGFAVLVPLTLIGVAIANWFRRRAVRSEMPGTTFLSHRWWPAASALGVFVAGVFFFLRPHLMTMRANPHSGGAGYVVQVQAYLNMPQDPTRSYYENSAVWLSWYFGWGTLALAVLGACWLAYEQVAGRRRVWAPAFVVLLGTAVAVLAVPSITPDHPWADRRFVPVVLPGLVLFAVCAVAVAVRALGHLEAGRLQAGRGGRWSWQPASVRSVQVAVTVAAIALVVVPAWSGSKDVIYTQTETGEPQLVHQVCAALRPADVVLAVGNRAKAEWPGTLRVMCGVDAGYLNGIDEAASMAAIDAQARANGGRLILLAEGTADKNAAQSQAVWAGRPTASLITTEAPHTLVTRPGKPISFGTDIWLGQYRPGGS